MLQIIRIKLKSRIFSWITWIIFIAIAVTFAMWSGGSLNRKPSVAAKVNGKKITWSQVDRIYNNFVRNNKQENIDPKQLRKQAVNSLTEHTALILQSLQSGFVASDAQVLQTVASNPYFLEQGKFSVEKYNKFLAHHSINEQQYQQLLKDEILVEQIQVGLVLSNFSLDFEVQNALKLLQQRRDFGYTIIPLSMFKQTATVDEKEIAEYYGKNKELFATMEQVKLDFVEINSEDVLKNMQDIQVSDEEAKQFYEENIDNFTNPELVHVRHILIEAPKGSNKLISGEARAKAEDILAKIRLGEDFIKLAKEYSEDPGSARLGGDLSWVGRGELVKDFEKVAFSLTNSGDISDIVTTEFGFHVIQLIEKQKPEVQIFSEVEDVVKRQYLERQAKLKLVDSVEEMANLAFANSDSLEKVANELQLELKQTDFFERNAKVESITNNNITSFHNVVAAAFSEDVFEQGKNSDVIKISDNKYEERYIVIRIAERIPSKIKLLSEVTDEIKRNLLINKAKALAEQESNKIMEEIKENSSPYSVARDHNLTWEVAKNISRDNKENVTVMPVELISEVFSLNSQEVKKVSFINGDHAIIRLLSIKSDLQKVTSTKQQEMLKQLNLELTHLISNMEYLLYKKALLKTADIKIYI